VKNAFLFIFALCLSISSFSSAPPCGVSYAAELKYAVVAEDGVMLYRMTDNYDFAAVLTLPKTYYVEYVGTNSTYHRVRYMDLSSAYGGDLFVLKDALSVADLITAAAPYPVATVKNAVAGAKLYRAIDSSVEAAVIPSANTSLVYYGTITDAIGEAWHYVAHNQTLGYLADSALVEPFVLAPHPNSVLNGSDGGDTTAPVSGIPLTTVLLTAGIILPAIAIFLLMFHPIRRKKTARNVRTQSALRYYRKSGEPEGFLRGGKHNAESEPQRGYDAKGYYEPQHIDRRAYYDTPDDDRTEQPPHYSPRYPYDKY
jgi:hypothetical protein